MLFGEFASQRLFRLRIKRKVPSCFCQANMVKTTFPYSLEYFEGTHFVNSFLIASSIAMFSSLENTIAKLWEHVAAFSMVSNFWPETLSYIAGFFYNTVLVNIPAWALSHVFSVLTMGGLSFFSQCILVTGHRLFVYGLAAKKWCLRKNDDTFWKRLG